MTGNDRRIPSDGDLRARLTDEQFRVTQQCGTERPFTGPHLDEKRAGIYRCVCCDAPLFTSGAKYDSGSGWPSFYDKAGGVSELVDNSHNMRRIEIRCANCAAHLGHVFPDGPNPTGLRYCVNGTSLTFNPEDEPTE